MTTKLPPKREVSPRELREMFNNGDYQERLQRGELTAELADNRHPSSPKADVPYCTRSQKLVYRDRDGVEIAAVHQYLKPDGTLGASGRPDPKRLLHEGTLYIAWWAPGAGD